MVFSFFLGILISWFILFLYIDFEHRTSSVRRLPSCSILRSSRQCPTTDDSLPLISWYQMRAYRCSTPVRVTRCMSGASRTRHCPLHPRAPLTPRPWTGNGPWPASARFPIKSKPKCLRKSLETRGFFIRFSFRLTRKPSVSNANIVTVDFQKTKVLTCVKVYVWCTQQMY